MKYLLDTQELYFSAASAWEIGIKTRLGKYRLPEAPGRYLPQRLAEQGIGSLPVSQSHALRVYDLPLHHHDPFDRLLVAQALEEEMVILTADRACERHPVDMIWSGKWIRSPKKPPRRAA